MKTVNQREWGCLTTANVAMKKCETGIAKTTDSERKIRNVYFYLIYFKIKKLNFYIM